MASSSHMPNCSHLSLFVNDDFAVAGGGGGMRLFGLESSNVDDRLALLVTIMLVVQYRCVDDVGEGGLGDGQKM